MLKAILLGSLDWLKQSKVAWGVATSQAMDRISRGPELGYARRPAFLLNGSKPVPSQIPTIRRWRQVDAKIELHEAKKAGDHLDFRIKIDDEVYDFAVVKTRTLPAKTGKLQRVVRTPNHSVPYFEKDHAVFGPGEYGHGEMSTVWRGKLDIHESNPKKIEFSISDGQFQGRYCIKDFGPKGWSILRMKEPALPWKERMVYSAIDKKIDVAHQNPNMIAEHKIDGANYMIIPGEKENVVVSRRLSVTGQPINRAANIPQLKYHKFPKELCDKTIHAEVVADGGSSSLTAGLLNARPNTSRGNQLALRKPLVAYIWEVEGPEGYETRRNVARSINKYSPRLDARPLEHTPDRFALKRLCNPQLLRIPVSNEDTGETTKAFAERLKNEGQEGVVLKDKKAAYYEGVWIKDKKADLGDFVIVGYQEGTGKYVGKLGAVQVRPITAPKRGPVSKVGTGFSDFEREWIWAHRKNLLGRVVQVGSHETTHNGILRGPRYKGFHPESDIVIQDEQALRDYANGAGINPIKSAIEWRGK